MNTFADIRQELTLNTHRWLITGVAGFIGSHLLQQLLGMGQIVIGLDNFSTGHRRNLDDVRQTVSADQWQRFKLLHGDIRNKDDCDTACQGVDHVLHQAALGSVPRSIKDPAATSDNNISGFLNMLVAARDAGAKRFVYASSSSVYGDHPALPKIEDQIGSPLSPYAVTKYTDELYAKVFMRLFGLQTIGLRYFNVFGPRQDPHGSYAAVIPRWIAGLLRGEAVTINGDGKTSRDFCYIDNAVQANLLAACGDNQDAPGKSYNVACAASTTLNDLYALIGHNLAHLKPGIRLPEPHYAEFRAGDVRHSLACIDRAKALLGYRPAFSVHDGIALTVKWYLEKEATLLMD